LDGVERGSFEKLITNHPESEAVVEGAILPDTADGTVIPARDVERHRVFFV
jgi:hypothetical protein